jgi:very-short-patch-repair endonuclease
LILFPKPKKRIKPPKPLKRGKAIKKCRGSFKASDNGKRKPRRDPAKTEAWALQKRAEKLADLSPAQLAIGAILSRYGIRFEYEKYWPNGDYPVFSDLHLPDHKITIECDGNFHRGQRRADMGKAMYIARNFGVGTIRFWNSECLDGTAEARIKQAFGF